MACLPPNTRLECQFSSLHVAQLLSQCLVRLDAVGNRMPQQVLDSVIVGNNDLSVSSLIKWLARDP